MPGTRPVNTPADVPMSKAKSSSNNIGLFLSAEKKYQEKRVSRVLRLILAGLLPVDTRVTLL